LDIYKRTRWISISLKIEECMEKDNFKVIIEQFGTRIEFATNKFETHADMEEIFENILHIMTFSTKLKVHIISEEEEEDIE